MGGFWAHWFVEIGFYYKPVSLGLDNGYPRKRAFPGILKTGLENTRVKPFFSYFFRK
jgi:hypothetical protein